MMKSGKWLPALALLAFVFASCSKDPVSNLSNEESRIYITDYDSTVNFMAYKTYSISDSVAVIGDNGSVKQSTPADGAYITAVKKYMAAEGYTLVDKSSKPDVGIDVNRIMSTSTGVISYPDYYGSYGSYWDPYYWGYSGYDYYTPYSYGVYSITQGAVSIDMLDLKNAATNNKIVVIWTGLIRGEGLSDVTSADSQVKALFDQSPYLKTNG